MRDRQAETSRRSFLKAGAAGVIALSMTDLLSSQVEAAPIGATTVEPLRAGPAEQSMMIVDSHCHATPVWYADLDALVFEMDRNGVDHAVLVQIGGYFDNEYQFDAVAKHPGRFANVIIGDYTKPDAA